MPIAESNRRNPTNAARLSALAIAIATGHAAAQSCPVRPLNTGAAGSGYISGSVLFDDSGSGTPRTYISGQFGTLGAVTNASLIRWTGAEWEAVPGAPPYIERMCVQAEGARQSLYATDFYGTGFWKYDGATWTLLPPPPQIPDYSSIASMVSFDPDGPGPQPARIFASIKATQKLVSTTETIGILAQFDGEWSEIANLAGGSLAACDAGDGLHLYLAGTNFFCHWGTTPCQYDSRVYRLDGSTWTTLATTTDGVLRALSAFDPDGAGPRHAMLCLAGDFSSLTVNGAPMAAQRVAAWDGQSWAPLGAGIPGASGDVYALTPFKPAGSPPLLLATGSFQRSTGAPANALVAWNGVAWGHFGTGLMGLPGEDPVITLTPYTNHDSPSLLASVNAVIDRRSARGLLTWQNGAWSGLTDGPAGDVLSLNTFDEGSGAHLFAAGHFTYGSGLAFNNIARWDGSSWSPLGRGIEPSAGNPDPRILAMTVYNDGSGPALYAAGSFQSADGLAVANIARWSGSQWQAVGTYGLSGGAVRALEVHDPDGAGPLPPVLYAGGEFTYADGAPAQHLATWDGHRWSAVPDIDQASGSIYAIRSFDEPSGPTLYVGGDPFSISGLARNLVFRLTASGWESLPTLLGQVQGFPGVVRAFAYHNDGSGYHGYAVGAHALGGAARLDASGWTPLSETALPSAFAARSDDDGSGPVLYVGAARFAAAGASRINPWPDDQVRTITHAFDDGNGRAIFIGGEFSTVEVPSAPGIPNAVRPATGIARIPVCTPCYANCDNSNIAPILNVNDFICFQARFAAGDPYANCDGSNIAPILNANDFLCFLSRYAAGCP